MAEQAEGQPKSHQPVLLLLCGLPGSGKSTFCAALCGGGEQQSWTVVCQDEIGGPREKTVAAARAALVESGGGGGGGAAPPSQPRCVAVDRVHATPEQRADFLALALEAGARCHAVVLDLPVKDCKARAAAREHHPSGVAGTRAFAVVSRLASDARWPESGGGGGGTSSEGFAGVMRCADDADARLAVQAWRRYGAGGEAAVAEAWRGGVARRGGPPSERGIKRFFAAMPPPSSAAKKPAAAAAAAEEAEEKEEQRPHKRPAVVVEAAAAAAVAAPAAAPVPPPPSQPAAPLRPLPPPPLPPPHLAALVRATRDPAGAAARGEQRVLYYDDRVVLLLDAYPKARRHALVLARDATLFSGPEGVAALRAPRDLALLRRMAAVGSLWARREAARMAGGEGDEKGGGDDDDEGAVPLAPAEAEAAVRRAAEEDDGEEHQAVSCLPSGFKAGFHALPSMPQLHLHVLSTDLRSSRMKRRQHYASFLPPFFLDFGEVFAGLRRQAAAGVEGGGGGGEAASSARVVVDTAAASRAKERPLSQLPCHRCGATFGAWAGAQGLHQHLMACARTVAAAAAAAEGSPLFRVERI